MDYDQTVPLSALFDEVMIAVPTAPTPVVETAIVNAVIEAARVTRQMRAQLSVDAQAMVGRYDLPIPEGYTLAYVEGVCVNGQRYNPTRDKPCAKPEPTEDCFDSSACKAMRPGCMRGFLANTACGTETPMVSCSGKFYVDNKDTIILDPAPGSDQDYGIDIEVSLIPSRFMCAVPLGFFDDWKEEIGVGATVKILRGQEKMDVARYDRLSREWERMKLKMRNRMMNNNTAGDESILSGLTCSAARKLV